MSDSYMLNAILAYLEDRPSDARIFLRSKNFAECGVTVSDLFTRLQSSLAKAQNKQAISILLGVLRSCLEIQPPNSFTLAEENQAFYYGVEAVETRIEDILRTLEVNKEDLNEQDKTQRSRG